MDMRQHWIEEVDAAELRQGIDVVSRAGLIVNGMPDCVPLACYMAVSVMAYEATLSHRV